jgi:hypothetical protein
MFQKLDVSVLRWGGKTPTQLCPLERANLNHWTPHLRMETDPVSGTSCFLVSRILDDGKSPKNPVILTATYVLHMTAFNSWTIILILAEDKNSLLTGINVFNRQYINSHYKNKFYFLPKSFDFSLIAVTFYLFPARRDFAIHTDFSGFRVTDIEQDFLRFQTLL